MVSPLPTLLRRTASVAVAALTLLVPLLGVAAPAGAQPTPRTVSAAARTVAPAQPATGEHRRGRSDRAAHRSATGSSRGEESQRATVRPGAAQRTGQPPVPSQPASCAADPIGPPATCSPVLHHAGPRASGRDLAVGGARSPPCSCGH